MNLQMLTHILNTVVNSLTQMDSPYRRERINILCKKITIINDVAIQNKIVALTKIISIIGKFYKLPGNYNIIKTKKRQYVRARQIGSTIIKDMYGSTITLESLGKLYDQDHSNISHALKTVRNYNDVDIIFRREYDLIKRLIDAS